MRVGAFIPIFRFGRYCRGEDGNLKEYQLLRIYGSKFTLGTFEAGSSKPMFVGVELDGGRLRLER